ncbi:MAG: GWxTD domain-containing protein [Bacteroidota bacterium]
MKHIVLLCLLLPIAYFLHAIDASISFATFKSADQPYVEIYTHVLGNSIAYATEDSTQYQASVEMTIVFKQGEKIVLADKFNLISQEKTDFVDLKRYALNNGIYDLEVIVSDNYRENNKATYKNGVAIEYNTIDKVQQSDIQLVASAGAAKDKSHPFAKSHFLLEPLPYHFHGKGSNQLLFYNEVYAPNLEGQLQLRYFIQQQSNAQNRILRIEHKERKAKPLMPLLLAINIKDLPSGNYDLVLEVRDQNKELLSQKSVFFQRSNPALASAIEENLQEETPIEERFTEAFDAEQLEYSLRALSPVIPINLSERLVHILKENDLEQQRTFLYAYWQARNPQNTEFAYEAYMKVVRAVDKTFKSGFRYGFETDRGYRYLKYGQPDDIVNVQDDPVAPPYEIWSYNEFPMTKQNNIRFLFYNPSLAGGDYIILHSNAIGEINNPQWEVELYRNAPTEIEGSDHFSATRMQRNNGRRARQLMEDF